MTKKNENKKNQAELESELAHQIKKFNKHNPEYLAYMRRSGDDKCIQIIHLPGFDTVEHIMNVRASDIYLTGVRAVVGPEVMKFAAKTYKLLGEISSIERLQREIDRAQKECEGAWHNVDQNPLSQIGGINNNKVML